MQVTERRSPFLSPFMCACLGPCTCEHMHTHGDTQGDTWTHIGVGTREHAYEHTFVRPAQ